LKKLKNMEPEKIKVLLERFYTGETSRKEEAFLLKFFSQPAVPEELKAEKEHFQMLLQWQSESPLDESFDMQIMQKISASRKPESQSIGWYVLAGVAASVLLVLALWLGNWQDKKPALPGTKNNQALAYVQARTALQMVSGNLNEGLRPAARVVREINGSMEKASEIRTLGTAVKPLRKLSEIERARRLMESLNSVYINLEPGKK
jgi:hypothetical protein